MFRFSNGVLYLLAVHRVNHGRGPGGDSWSADDIPAEMSLRFIHFRGCVAKSKRMLTGQNPVCRDSYGITEHMGYALTYDSFSLAPLARSPGFYVFLSPELRRFCLPRLKDASPRIRTLRLEDNALRRDDSIHPILYNESDESHGHVQIALAKKAKFLADLIFPALSHSLTQIAKIYPFLRI